MHRALVSVLILLAGTIAACDRKAPVGGPTSGEGLMGSVRRTVAARPRQRLATPAAPLLAAALPLQDEKQATGDMVADAMRARLPVLRACYVRLARTGSAPGGKAVLSFTLGQDGDLQDIQVDAPDFVGTDLATCMARQVKHMTFPKTRSGGAQFSYPFVFSGG